MGLSKDEILDFAARYITEDEITDFAHEGDVFSLLIRDLEENKILADEEGWGFGGYGLCIGYTIDEDAKPRGKWLWLHFAALQSFPPSPQVIRLQPPHVVKGRFQNPERTREIRIVKVNIANALNAAEENGKKSTTKKQPAEEKSSQEPEAKILQFRKKETSKKKSPKS